MAEDWEDVNKRAFWMLVQTWLLKSDQDAMSCVFILHKAQRCKKAGIPMNLIQAVQEFIDWQVHSKEKPKWYETPLTDGIA